MVGGGAGTDWNSRADDEGDAARNKGGSMVMDSWNSGLFGGGEIKT